MKREEPKMGGKPVSILVASDLGDLRVTRKARPRLTEVRSTTGPIFHFTPKRRVGSAACVCPELQEASVSLRPALESISHSPL